MHKGTHFSCRVKVNDVSPVFNTSETKTMLDMQFVVKIINLNCAYSLRSLATEFTIVDYKLKHSNHHHILSSISTVSQKLW